MSKRSISSAFFVLDFFPNFLRKIKEYLHAYTYMPAVWSVLLFLTAVHADKPPCPLLRGCYTVSTVIVIYEGMLGSVRTATTTPKESAPVHYLAA